MRLSETTLRIRDEERQDLIEEARRAAQRMIVAHRDRIDELAHELLEHEVLDREAIDRIMVLDGVMTNPELVWLSTEEEKVAFFRLMAPSLPPERLPHAQHGRLEPRIRLEPLLHRAVEEQVR